MDAIAASLVIESVLAVAGAVYVVVAYRRSRQNGSVPVLYTLLVALCIVVATCGVGIAIVGAFYFANQHFPVGGYLLLATAYILLSVPVSTAVIIWALRRRPGPPPSDPPSEGGSHEP